MWSNYHAKQRCYDDYRTRSLLSAYVYIATGRKPAFNSKMRQKNELRFNSRDDGNTLGALYLEYRAD